MTTPLTSSNADHKGVARHRKVIGGEDPRTNQHLPLPDCELIIGKLDQLIAWMKEIGMSGIIGCETPAPSRRSENILCQVDLCIGYAPPKTIFNLKQYQWGDYIPHLRETNSTPDSLERLIPGFNATISSLVMPLKR